MCCVCVCVCVCVCACVCMCAHVLCVECTTHKAVHVAQDESRDSLQYISKIHRFSFITK